MLYFMSIFFSWDYFFIFNLMRTFTHLPLFFQIQRGTVPIPKSVTPSRIQSNFEVFDFELTPDEIKTMDGLDCNGRICSFDE